MKELQIFKNENFGEIRVVEVNNEPMFCLSDICRVLDLQAGATKNRLDPKGISLINTLTKGGKQDIVFVNEKNLYKVIMRSDKPQAEPFQDWVCGEVLPTIRKTGSYSLATKLPTTYLEALKALVKSEEEKQRLTLENKQKSDRIEEDKPKVDFANDIIGSKTNCSIKELATILAQNGIKIGQNRLYKLLRSKGFLGKYMEYYNMPNQKYVEMGLFEIRKGTRTGYDGSLITTTTTRVTTKGQYYFVNLFLHKRDLLDSLVPLADEEDAEYDE